jgi:hypothetical protein
MKRIIILERLRFIGGGYLTKGSKNERLPQTTGNQKPDAFSRPSATA